MTDEVTGVLCEQFDVLGSQFRGPGLPIGQVLKECCQSLLVRMLVLWIGTRREGQASQVAILGHTGR